jgi:hypothetical protein
VSVRGTHSGETKGTTASSPEQDSAALECPTRRANLESAAGVLAAVFQSLTGNEVGTALRHTAGARELPRGREGAKITCN